MSISLKGHVQELTSATLVDPEVESAGVPGRPSFRSDKTVFEQAGPVPDSPRSFEEKDQRDARPPLTFVPPENKNRCLILCFDGTGDSFDADNSNIVNFVSALKKDERTKQMVYYQSGIGTYGGKMASPAANKISLTLDAMIAWNLDSHVMAGYEFLMQNYTANDRICMFGFSRGAYIARSLAGMIHKVGLLPVDNHQQVPFAYRMYTRADAVGWAQSNAFKKAFSNDVHIDFIGVWDTVDSVGLIPKRLPFTTSNTIVRTFRHAVSLDEHRSKFKANLWNFPSDQEKKLGIPPTLPATPKRPSPKFRATLPFPTLPPLHFKKSTESDDDVEQTKYETSFAQRHHKTRPTDVLEVWFAGCHCDVGGGSVPNDTRNSLARIPLRWMIRECFKADTGILFDAGRLQELGLDPATLYPFVLPRPPPLSAEKEILPKPQGWLRRLLSGKKRKDDFTMAAELEDKPLEKPQPGMEEEEELKDALSPVYDQLHLNPVWWILEFIPFTFRYQHEGQWVTEFRANFGRPRTIPHQRPHEKDKPSYPNHKPPVNLHIHRSVKMRRAAGYVNRARFYCDPVWVD
ncbi:hypothetical protein C8F04DRAFT_1137769 [Mycena alexandri]|uniref:T6SS Phospholipase effector Tle1-like catalytic domain-containing protein n=1 Tax=Mycena alexandri TaxID=1745969 RepID=A0AAD6S7I8_9AGAR|nr:hypothetical protein C8F04DRAFT_1137769 [Mycena alexandri]